MEFDLLSTVGSDPTMAAVFSERRAIQDWLAVEAGFAHGLAAAGVIDDQRCRRIVEACRIEIVDVHALWRDTALVGYPILPLVRMICSALPNDDAGFVHLGATTQDIMDSALAMQLRDAGDRLIAQIDELGDALGVLVDRHARTVMAGRTHAQQAVPTTFGAKCAVFLDEFSRHRARLLRARTSVAVVSLFGAGGTSAALTDHAPTVRRVLAEQLGLADAVVPWHVARDRIAEFATTCSLVAASCVRLAREMADLSRTEIGEIAEEDGLYRGASSTMPQKANPISAEVTIGFGVMAAAYGTAMLRAMEAGHERAAGEWQIEWQAMPGVCLATAGALRAAGALARGLRVFPDRMRANLDADGGRIMAEAYMITLAEQVGRAQAHEVVYRAARDSRDSNRPLTDTVRMYLSDDVWAAVADRIPAAEAYLGAASQICETALSTWRDRAISGEEG